MAESNTIQSGFSIYTRLNLKKKQRYGMNNEKASSRALMNLERALKTRRIDYLTYQNEKEQIENRISKIYDDETTCSKGRRK